MALSFTPLTGVSNNTGGTSQTTPASTTPAGPFLALVTVLQSTAITSVTDNKGNTYTKIWDSPGEPGSGEICSLYACNNAAGGSGHTWTMNGGVAYATLMPGYCTGHDTSSPFLTVPVVQGTGTGNSISLSQPTLAQANCLLLMPILVNGAADQPTMVAPSGFSTWFTQRDWNYWTGCAFYFITSSTASATRTATGSPWNSTTGGIIGIKEAAASGVTGTVAWTEANDTASLTGSLTVSGSSGWTEASDTASVTGSVRVSSSASWTEANDTAALTGNLTVAGAPSWTEASDSASISGALTVSGAASWTEASDTASIAGSATVSGTAAWAEASDTASLTGTVGSVVAGALVWTEADDTAAVVGSLTVSGGASWTEPSDSWALVGQVTQPTTGALAWTEATDAWSIAGLVTQPASGSVSWTEDGDLWTVNVQVGNGSGGGNDPAKRKKRVQQQVNELNRRILEAEALEEAKSKKDKKVAQGVVEFQPETWDEDEDEALMLLI